MSPTGIPLMLGDSVNSGAIVVDGVTIGDVAAGPPLADGAESGPVFGLTVIATMRPPGSRPAFDAW